MGLTHGSVVCFRPTDLALRTFPSSTRKAAERDRRLHTEAVLALLKQPASDLPRGAKGRAEPSLAKRADTLLQGSELGAAGNVSSSPL